MRAALTTIESKHGLSGALFPAQRRFLADISRQITAVCTRRAGKTYACAAKLLDTARKRAGCTALYITLSRTNAKRIVWETLKQLNAEQNIGGEVKEAELCIELPNGSRVYLSGANDSGEIEKFRGLALGIVIIDEAQSFPAYLQRMIDEVLAPALMDFAGAIVLIGTPGPVPIGYYHACSSSPEWSHHEWSVFDNPWIKRKSGLEPRDLLAAELKRRGVAETDPIIQREWFARWVLDLNSLVFRYSRERNDFSAAPGGKLQHIIGVDLGFDDADAIAVLSWAKDDPRLFLTREDVLTKQTPTQLGDKLKTMADKLEPLAIVIDTGGLGKKIAEELTGRWGLAVEAAEKDRKLEHIELLNDGLRSGRVFAKASSRFAQDCHLVEWDKSNPEKWRIGDKFHSDICDAVLYAYRKALHWTERVPTKEEKPRPGSAAWVARNEAAVMKQLEEQMERDEEEVRQRKQERDEMETERLVFS